MLKVTYRLNLGQDQFELQADVQDEKEFFETMSFFSNLPKVAPGGANDLRLTFRTTSEGHKYYSLVSEIEQMEFKFGQTKENNGGGLFPKGWEPKYQGKQDNSNYQQQGGVPGPFATQQIPQPTQYPPVGQTLQGSNVYPGAGVTPPVQPANQQPKQAVQQSTNNVLARFGINKQ